MISMTGFGRAVASAGARRIVVEVRSVNHRGLEVKVRGRGLSAAAEVEAIRFVRSKCSRGSVQVAIDDEREAGSEARDDDLAPARLQALHTRLEQLRQQLGGLDGKIVDLMTLQAFVRLERDRSANAQPQPEPLTWEQIQPAVAEAVDQLRRFRSTEGQALAGELRMRAGRLAALVDEVRPKLPSSAERARTRLLERVTTFAASLGEPSGIDPGRMAQEVALLADRLDVTEEMARLDAHLARLHESLAGSLPERGEGVGRPLEFLLQELGRELNTLGTKAQDAEISALVIASKAELEKIREQAQNIE
ncbi:MAG TPA: YicC/YloC family endoribonuclease [Polyangia bacterium]